MCTAATVIIIMDDIKVTDMKILCCRPACHVIKALCDTLNLVVCSQKKRAEALTSTHVDRLFSSLIVPSDPSFAKLVEVSE